MNKDNICIGKCAICGSELGISGIATAFSEAGEWLSQDVWSDKGSLCVQCLDSRGRLAMMYLHEYNR